MSYEGAMDFTEQWDSKEYRRLMVATLMQLVEGHGNYALVNVREQADETHVEMVLRQPYHFLKNGKTTSVARVTFTLTAYPE